MRLEHAAGQDQSHLPLGRPLPIFNVLAFYFELQQPATRSQLHALVKHASKESEAAHLSKLAEFGADNTGEVSEDRATLYEQYILAERRRTPASENG